jgi:hypothetical protein
MVLWMWRGEDRLEAEVLREEMEEESTVEEPERERCREEEVVDFLKQEHIYIVKS